MIRQKTARLLSVHRFRWLPKNGRSVLVFPLSVDCEADLDGRWTLLHEAMHRAVSLGFAHYESLEIQTEIER